MCGLRWQSPILAAGRGRPGSEHLFILSPMQPRPERPVTEHRGKFPQRGAGGGLGVSRSLEAPCFSWSSQHKEVKLTPAGRQGQEEACLHRAGHPQDHRCGPLT